MIFASFDALNRRIASGEVLSPLAAVMCDSDVRKPERMLKLAKDALDALDKLDAECDAAYCREELDLALDINCAMADVGDIVVRLEARE